MNDLIKNSPQTSTNSTLHFQLSFHDTLETLRVGNNLWSCLAVSKVIRSEILIFLAETIIGFLIAADHIYGVFLFQKLGPFNEFILNKKEQSIFSFLITHTLLKSLYSFTLSLHPIRQFTKKTMAVHYHYRCLKFTLCGIVVVKCRAHYEFMKVKK